MQGVASFGGGGREPGAKECGQPVAPGQRSPRKGAQPWQLCDSHPLGPVSTSDLESLQDNKSVAFEPPNVWQFAAEAREHSCSRESPEASCTLVSRFSSHSASSPALNSHPVCLPVRPRSNVLLSTTSPHFCPEWPKIFLLSMALSWNLSSRFRPYRKIAWPTPSCPCGS